MVYCSPALTDMIKNSSLAANSSAEAHAKQRALARSRKLSKPNANDVERAKQLWERLRIKSEVPAEERKDLLTELFSLITGRVKDFVFKHDSVRTIQTAVKYSTAEQRKVIAKELKGEYRALVEGRYSKFLVAKLLVMGDATTRAMIIEDFYGHVKKLINHPEASWILDDTYRQVATKPQKVLLLREWFGPEYAVLAKNKEGANADLVGLLKEHPEKRQPALDHLGNMIDQLVQKKMTAFTMLHDAMEQYSLAVSTNLDGTLDTKSEAVAEWVQSLIPDDEDEFDLLKNLAFTASGCRVVTRALAMGNAKDRRRMLRVYRDHIETVACDANAVNVLLAIYEVVDDTKLTSKLIFPELLAEKTVDQQEREAAISAIAKHPIGRIALLWPLVSENGRAPKWLIWPDSLSDVVMKEVNKIKTVADTSKKESKARREELAQALLTTMKGCILSTVAHRARDLASTAYGCAFITRVLLQGDLESIGKSADYEKAVSAVAEIAAEDLSGEQPITSSPGGGRMLKTLAQGGPFDHDTGKIKQLSSLTAFPNLLWSHIRPRVEGWMIQPRAFILNAVAENGHFKKRKDLFEALQVHKKVLDEASEKGDRGAAMLLQKKD